MAFPKKYRLSGTRLFDTVFKKGQTVRGRFFIIKFLRNGLAHGRLAIVVPRNVAKQAVQRNFLKRRVTELVDVNRLSTVRRDAIVLLLPSILRKDIREIKSELTQDIDIFFVQP